MLRIQREKSHASAASGFATNSKSSCVPLAYLAAKTIIGKIPSQPRSITLTECRVEYGNSSHVGMWRSVHARYEPAVKMKT
jgi:hypothetical protein